MALVETARNYWTIVREYRFSPDWKKKLILRGDMAQACRVMEPELLRNRIRVFWDQQAALLQLDSEKWKSWV